MGCGSLVCLGTIASKLRLISYTMAAAMQLSLFIVIVITNVHRASILVVFITSLHLSLLVSPRVSLITYFY